MKGDSTIVFVFLLLIGNLLGGGQTYVFSIHLTVQENTRTFILEVLVNHPVTV